LKRTAASISAFNPPDDQKIALKTKSRRAAFLSGNMIEKRKRPMPAASALFGSMRVAAINSALYPPVPAA
jgi:hypothetical protein